MTGNCHSEGEDRIRQRVDIKAWAFDFAEPNRLRTGRKIVAHPLVVGFGHQRYQLLKPGFAAPSQNLPGLPGIADKMVDLGGAVEGRVYPDDRLAAAAIGPAFVRPAPDHSISNWRRRAAVSTKARTVWVSLVAST